MYCVTLLLVLLGSNLVLAFENLIQAQGELRKDLPVQPLQYAAPNWRIYHNTDHLLKELLSTAQSCQNVIMTPHQLRPGDPFTPGSSEKPEQLSWSTQVLPPASEGLLFFSVKARTPKRFSMGAVPKVNIPAVFVFGEQGRELITSEICLRIVQHLCSATSNDFHLPDDVELVLIPFANPDGRRIAEMGRRCEKTNGNDVELDRNWPRFWRVSHQISDPRPKTEKLSTFRAVMSRRFKRRVVQADDFALPLTGTHPFSEPETRALRSIVALLKPATYVSVRTGAPAITLPWDCDPTLMSDKEHIRLSRILESVIAEHCTRCKSGPLGNVTGTSKCGTSSDYMYGTMRVPFVHSWQVYHIPAARGDCFRRNNPLNKLEYERVTTNWAYAVVNFTIAVRNWMVLESEQGFESAEQNASMSAAKASVRRARAIASGIPDPEVFRMDRESEENPSRGHERRSSSALKVEINTRNGVLGSPRPISQLSAPNGDVAADRIHSTAKTKENNEHDATSNHGEDYRVGLLAGWAGAWASMGILLVGLFVSRRCVFIREPRRRVIRVRASRSSVKNA